MFEKILKELRIEENYSQKELADKIGLSKNIICEYEKGRSEPSIETLTKFADIFNVSIDYLCGREQEQLTIKSKKNDLQKHTKNEEELLIYFKRLNELQQQKVIGYCYALCH